jgi:hypothetical protein
VPNLIEEGRIENLELQIDLLIDRVELVPEYKRMALLFITPGKVRLLEKGTTIWSGELQTVPAT